MEMIACKGGGCAQVGAQCSVHELVHVSNFM